MPDQPTKPAWPHYQPPNPHGIPTTSYSQSRLLMKAIKTFGKVKTPARRGKRGLISNDTIQIRHKKPKFW